MQAWTNFIDAAFYTRNTPGWERALRVLLAAGLTARALLGGGGPVAVGLLLATAVTLLATASTGFCPMCYFAGRRSLARRSKA